MKRRGLEHLAHIEEELEEIKERQGGVWSSLHSGLFQGTGWVVGSILTVALLGIILSAFGVIPGLSGLAQYLQSIQAQMHK